MKKPNPEIEQAEHQLRFAQQQVESGKRALTNTDIDPKVAKRVEDAVAYWEKQTIIAQQHLDVVRSADGASKQNQR